MKDSRISVPTRATLCRGVALVTALIVSSLVAALAMTLTSRSTLWINQVQNRQDFAQAQFVALAAIDVARLALRDDARNNSADHLREAWAIPMPAVSAEGGKVGGRIVEMQGFFNLSNLVRSGKVDEQALQGFERLLALIGLDPALANKLLDALKSEGDARKKASTAFVFPYADISVLEHVSGFDARTLARLREVAVVLPEPTRINVNFATPEALYAAMPTLSAAEAASIVSLRAGNYYPTVKAFIEAQPETVRSKVGVDDITVQSRYFLAEIDASFGRVQLRYQAMLVRNGVNMPEVVWLRRSYQ